MVTELTKNEIAERATTNFVKDLLAQHKLTRRSRLGKVIGLGEKKSEEIDDIKEYVKTTSNVLLEHVDGIGKKTATKLGEVGVWTPSDLYRAYKRGHHEELRGLPSIELDALVRGIMGTPEADPNLTFDNVRRIMRRSKGQPFVTRRSDEIKRYFNLFGIRESTRGRDDRGHVITLQDFGGFLTNNDIKNLKGRVCGMLGKSPTCTVGSHVVTGLSVVKKEGKRDKAKRTIVALSLGNFLRNLTTGGNESYVKNGTLKKLYPSPTGRDEADITIVKELVSELEREGKVKGGTLGYVTPTDDAIYEEVMRSKSITVGSTANTRMADYLTLIGKGDDIFDNAGKLVYDLDQLIENGKFIARVALRKGANFNKDFENFTTIIGTNPKIGFIPRGFTHEERTETVGMRNQFNVFVQVPSELANGFFKPSGFHVDTNDDYVFVIDDKHKKPFVKDNNLTNIWAKRPLPVKAKNNFVKTYKYAGNACPLGSNEREERTVAYLKEIIDTEDRLNITKVGRSNSGVVRAIINDIVTSKNTLTPYEEALKRRLASVENKTDPIYLHDVNIETLGTWIVKNESFVGSTIKDKTKIIDTIKLGLKELDDARMENKKKLGTIYKKRRVMCELNDIDKDYDQGRSYVTIPKNQLVWKNMRPFIDECAKTPNQERCVIDTILFHQNTTERFNEETPIERELHKITKQSMSKDDLSTLKDIAIMRRTEHGKIEGGSIAIHRVTKKADVGDKQMLDIGKWKFLNSPAIKNVVELVTVRSSRGTNRHRNDTCPI